MTDLSGKRKNRKKQDITCEVSSSRASGVSNHGFEIVGSAGNVGVPVLDNMLNRSSVLSEEFSVVESAGSDCWDAHAVTEEEDDILHFLHGVGEIGEEVAALFELDASEVLPVGGRDLLRSDFVGGRGEVVVTGLHPSCKKEQYCCKVCQEHCCLGA